MANIKADLHGFQNSYDHFNGTTFENVSRFDIFCSVISVGAAGPLDFINYGWRNFPKNLFFGLMIPGYVESKKGLLCKSASFDALIQSEKTIFTYWLGMAFTKLVAGRRLRIPWLCHVERLIEQGILQPISGTWERGDLVGLDVNKSWHVLESKGRSYNINKDTIDYAKGQASRSILINGMPPSTASASITRLFTEPISVEFIDPSIDDEEMDYWKVNEKEFFPAYYKPLIRHISERKRISTRIFGIEFYVTEAEEFGRGIWVGLAKRILENPENATSTASHLYEILGVQTSADTDNTQTEKFSIGYDGIILGADLHHFLS